MKIAHPHEHVVRIVIPIRPRPTNLPARLRQALTELTDASAAYSYARAARIAVQRQHEMEHG